jgi:hypothetical protein
MAAINETAQAIAWLKATLKGDAATVAAAPGGIWRGALPQKATVAPWCVYSYYAGPGPVIGTPSLRLWNDSQYIVKAVGPAHQDADIITLANALDALLQDNKGSTSSATILECIRVGDFNFDETVNSHKYWHLGGIWRILVRGN